MSGRFDVRMARAVVGAGLVGAVTVEIYLFAVGLAAWPGTYQWIASGLLGPGAYSTIAFAWLGVALHAGISLAWAGLWAATSARWPRLAARPATHGLAYGVLVFVAMQGVAWLGGIWAAPTPAVLLHYVVDHAVFFGVPVAAVYARLNASPRSRRAVPNTFAA